MKSSIPVLKIADINKQQRNKESKEWRGVCVCVWPTRLGDRVRREVTGGKGGVCAVDLR